MLDNRLRDRSILSHHFEVVVPTLLWASGLYLDRHSLEHFAGCSGLPVFEEVFVVPDEQQVALLFTGRPLQPPYSFEALPFLGFFSNAQGLFEVPAEHS